MWKITKKIRRLKKFTGNDRLIVHFLVYIQEKQMETKQLQAELSNKRKEILLVHDYKIVFKISENLKQ